MLKPVILPIMKKGRSDDWVANCATCFETFCITAKDSPNCPKAMFCPDCRGRVKAPGVLNFRRRAGGGNY